MKRIICAAAFIAVSGMAILPMQAMAQVGVNIIIGTPPPPPRYEPLPPPRGGYVWVPGYWEWDGGRRVWAEGHWEQVRRGYVYDRPEWREGDHGWELRRGGWHRHKDRDDRDDHCPPGQAKKGNC